MGTQDFRKTFGPEYPAAIMHENIRMPLRRESRFARHYHSDQHKSGCHLSRFMDHSASITALELQRKWSNWPEELQMDFCQSCYWLFNQDDYPEMLRFIMRRGGQKHWSAIALEIASGLPQAEAFDILVCALRNTDLEHSSNVAQAIAKTKHPGAEAVLRGHLTKLWAHPSLWDDAEFINWFAFGATTCIAHLIEIGAPTADFAEQVRKLSQHVCPRNRSTNSERLSKHYSEMSFPD